MKKNSPGCTCCKPTVFGSQSLWVLDDVEYIGATIVGMDPYRATIETTSFNFETLQVQPEWMVHVNTWGDVNYFIEKGTDPGYIGGERVLAAHGFYHEYRPGNTTPPGEGYLTPTGGPV